jgi:4-amino-4-deoxy-L-arabinose transferase-like glycosyltransferase
MELFWLENFLQSKRNVWIVAAITTFLLLIANLPWQLDDYDQAKQAFTSFEMIKEGHWFYQRTPHERVATKPPLVGWVSAGLLALTKSWDVAWRLPSLLAAIALSILLFRAATSAYGLVAGLMAFSAFGLNLLSPRLATLVRTDMPLALVIFLIGLLIWRKIRKEEPWRLQDQVYIFALLTAAMLIKGPIVYAFLLPGILFFQLMERGRHACHHSAWCGWWPWLASFGVFLLWILGGITFQPGFFDQVVVREFAGRFDETIHLPQPLYFYLPHVLHKFAPWSVLIIAIAILDLRLRRWRISAALREMSPGTFWLICWTLGGLLVMSLIPSKRVDRIFPIIPPLCLLLAVQVTNRYAACSHGSVSRSSMSLDADLTGHRPVATEDKGRRARIYRWSAVALLLSILVTCGYTISKVFSGCHNHRNALVVFGREVRREAETRHWRYEAISAKDEGLLLYLRKTHFIKSERAVVEWNRGDLDALVVSSDKAPALMRELRDAALSELKSNEGKNQRRSYVLITRQGGLLPMRGRGRIGAAAPFSILRIGKWKRSPWIAKSCTCATVSFRNTAN